MVGFGTNEHGCAVSLMLERTAYNMSVYTLFPLHVL